MCEQRMGFQSLVTEPETFKFDFWSVKPPLAEFGHVFWFLWALVFSDAKLN